MEDVSKVAGHSTIKVTERHYYKQLEERQSRMFSDLEDHMIQSQSREKIDEHEKTGTGNR